MRYVFGSCELNTQTGELRRAGIPVPLAPKVYALLAYLIACRDRLVPKEELLAQVWPGTRVDDSAVKRCIMAARQAIGDLPAASHYIRTLRGQGYRFIAGVTVEAPSASDTQITPRHQHCPASPPVTGQDAALVDPSDPTTATPTETLCCVVCQHRNAPMARFCLACGAQMPAICSHCRQPVRPPAVFCPACGNRLTFLRAPAPFSHPQATPPSAASGIRPGQPLSPGERKLVTVLYGAAMQAVSRSIGSRLEELHRLTQVVYRSASQVAQQYAGTLQLIPGEGFLMVFGVPLAQEDHAQRAVLAALGLQRRLYEAPAALPAGEALGLRIALHSGLIVAGQLGDEPLAMVVGETATVAAALARHAATGTILASEATLRFVQGEVRTIPVPALQIAEHTPPIPLAQIQQFIPRHMPLAVIEARPRSPFVGREAELAVLQERLTRVEQGQGQVVGVVGEPGIGKSRLLDEFRLAHSTRAVVYLHGECQSYGQTTPYFPLQAVIRAAWGVTEADPAAVMTKVQSGLHAMALEPERWAPYFLPLLGVHAESNHAPEMSAEHRQERLPEALHQFFIRHSQRQPYILALENLHWLDTSTAAYLPRLVERLAGVPILLLVTFRPGYRPLWLAKSYATQIALQPLGDDDSRVIVRTMLHHTPCPAALEHQIMQNAEGNPFFLEELAQTVLEHRPPRSTVVIPESIQAVIAARIDRLLPEEKRLLQTVAALGKEVSLPLLQAVVGTTAETLLAGLAHLQAAEFLSEIRLVPEPTYTFKHVLTQAVAYNSLLQEQRRALHARIVDVLGTFAANQVTEQVDELAQPAWRGAV